MKIAEKVGEFFKGGFAISKGIAHKAGKKAVELGSMGAIKIESAQLKADEKDLMERLGNEVYTALMGKNLAPITRDTPGIGELVIAITKLRKHLASKDKEYLAIGTTTKAKD